MSEDVTRRGGSPSPVIGRDIANRTQDITSTGSENKTDAAKQKPRRQPCCGFCRNHNREVPVTNHNCMFAECQCPFCELTRRRRKIMRHQQRLWRYKKFSRGQKEGEENPGDGEVTPNDNFPHEEPQQQQHQHLDIQRTRRKMVCDKCRNHNKSVEKRGHKPCPYDTCECNLCIFTIKRQKLMKHQQRVRRAQISGPTEHTDMSQQPHPLTDTDSPDNDLQPMEQQVALPTTPPTGTGRLEERKEEGANKPVKIPPVPAAPLDISTPNGMEWRSAGREFTSGKEVSRVQQTSFHPVITTTTPITTSTTTTTLSHPRPIDPMPNYQVTSDIHSSNLFDKSKHSVSLPLSIECSGNMKVSVRCGCFGSLPQVPGAGTTTTTTTTTLPSLPTYGLDVRHQRFMPWIGRVSETGDRCLMEGNNSVRPQAPLRPQPIPATRLPPPQMDWQFRGFPYSSASAFQSVSQPSGSLFVCDHLRAHYSQTSLDEHWQGSRGPHPSESNGIHASLSTAGLPYFASALLHPSAKPSLSLMPTARTLPDYSSPLAGFRQRDQN